MLLVLYVDMQWSKLKFEPNIQGQLLARLKGSAYCPERNALHPAVHKEVRLQIIERAQIGGGHTIRYCCPDSAGEGRVVGRFQPPLQIRVCSSVCALKI